ncbi:hypothetical protein HMSSN036_44620 [Paenibacillus macerans]|nr:hypothetical protein HMSSN036_44620 [Paenibacillus macerans]
MSSKKRFKSWLVFTVCLALAVSVLSGCQSAGNSRESGPSSAPEQSSFKAGTYTGEAEGKDGTVKVEVTMEEPDQIKDIQIISQTETEGLGDAALEKIKEQILQNQTLAVDAVSGASKSSEAMLTAVEKAVQQAGGDLTALKSGGVAKAGEGKTEKLQADVVVVGAGASGVSAAVTAADKGAKVIIVEKTGVIGGASNLSWAGKFYNSSAAVENGIKVNVEQEIADWIANNHWRVDAAAIRQYVTKSGETYDWLKSKGYVTTFLNFAGEQLHVLPAYDTREQTLRKMLAASVEKNGGQVITETTAKELMTDASGAVVGVKPQRPTARPWKFPRKAWSWRRADTRATKKWSRKRLALKA